MESAQSLGTSSLGERVAHTTPLQLTLFPGSVSQPLSLRRVGLKRTLGTGLPYSTPKVHIPFTMSMGNLTYALLFSRMILFSIGFILTKIKLPKFHATTVYCKSHVNKPAWRAFEGEGKGDFGRGRREGVRVSHPPRAPLTYLSPANACHTGYI